jgi:thymidine kinase
VAQLYFYYSAMNAGKSTSLLQSAHNYREQGMQVALYTAAIDDRYGPGIIRSRIGLEETAAQFDSGSDFYRSIAQSHRQSPLACVLVDEAQFLSSSQVDELARVVDQLHIPVLCFGIRTDFQGQLFPGSSRLLAIADKLQELKTVCRCGKKATMTVRLDEKGQVMSAGHQVEIGGNDRYESKCRQHYRELMDAAHAAGLVDESAVGI